MRKEQHRINKPQREREREREHNTLQFSPAVNPLNFELIIKPMIGMTTDMPNVEKKAAELSAVLDVYEAHLSKNKYLAGDEFTLVDLNHMPEVYLLCKSSKGDLINSRPHVKACVDCSQFVLCCVVLVCFGLV
jgi:glutathione S-transferase